MRVTRTTTLPKGSRALASAPPLTPHVDPATALQRLRHHAGRALTRQALDGEQRYRDAHVALAGRRLSAGVVAGLRISASDGTDGSLLILGPGRGLSASGHDVVVRGELVVAVDDLAVVPDSAEDVPPRGVGVLLLQPVVVERRSPEDPADRERAFRDPCPIDPSALAFDEFQLLDGARLAFHPWPADWPDMADPTEAAQRRNLLAYQIYRREAEGGPAALPWTTHGIPLALVAIDAEGRVAAARSRRRGTAGRRAAAHPGRCRPRHAVPLAGAARRPDGARRRARPGRLGRPRCRRDLPPPAAGRHPAAHRLGQRGVLPRYVPPSARAGAARAARSAARGGRPVSPPST